MKLTSSEIYSKIINFKDFKGLKKIDNIRSRYKIGSILGEGAFGKVRIAMHKMANIKCAIKIIKIKSIASNKLYKSMLEKEFQTLENTNHPNIMKIYELLYDDKCYYIVSEFIEFGELYNFIVDNEIELKENDAKKITKQIFMAINYMH